MNQCRNIGTYVLNVIIDYPLCEKDFLYIAVVPEPGGPGGPLAPPQYLLDQLTLFKGRADYPHLLLLHSGTAY